MHILGRASTQTDALTVSETVHASIVQTLNAMTRLRLMMASPVTHVLPAGTVTASLAPTSTTVLEIHVDLQR
jgi:hypothetical protein